MPEGNYWSRRGVNRRAVLRGGGVGLAGLAGAALIGCGGGDEAGVVDDEPRTSEGLFKGPTSTAAEVGGTPVPKDQVRIKPGFYDQPVGPTAAERNPLVNGRYGGTLVGTYLDPPGMDINRTLSCTIYSTMNLTNNKLVRGKTGPLAHPFLVEIEGDLAESWEESPDSTEFTFHLREGIKTHNVEPTRGREYSSEDVRLSIDRYRAGGVQRDVWAQVASVETPDPSTVKVKLSEPLADFTTNIAAWSFMWVKELIESPDQIQNKAVGTGPFVQQEWTKKERSVFVKHPDYMEKGLPFLDRVVDIVQSDTAALRAAYITDNLFTDSFRDTPDQQDLRNRSDDSVLWKYPVSRGANVNGWHFQMRNPAFQDVRVRRAISMAFDRDELDLARNYGDNMSPEGAFSLAPMPWALLYDQYPTAAANGPWYRFDVAQARQLLQAAGYTERNPLTWTHVTWYDREASAQNIIPGINAVLPEAKIEFRQVDNPTQVTLMSDRNFDATVGIVWGPPSYSMDQWVYSWYVQGGSVNYNEKGNAELDALLQAQRRDANMTSKKETWQKIWDTIHDQVWDFWWPQAYNRSNWHNYVLGYRPHGWIGTWGCYSSDQVRTMWLDEGHKMKTG